MMKEKTLIFGASGQTGRELLKIIPESIPVFHGVNKEANEINFENADEIKKLIEKNNPSIIVNAVALTNVDRCETEKELAYKINSESVRIMARMCSARKIKLVHVSTDYVFDGEAGNYREDAIPNPINYYGLSKLMGDNFAQIPENSMIVRTSGVYGYSRNFPKFAYETLKKGDKLNTINGYYSPIHSRNLAKAIAELIDKDFNGIINVCGEKTSRYDLALKISKRFGLNGVIEKMDNIQNLKAKRPFDSSLYIGFSKSILNFDFYSTESNLKEFEKTVEIQ